MSAALETFHTAWIQAWLDNDARALEGMAAKDFVHVTTNGTSLDRAALATTIEDRSHRIEWGKCYDVTVRELGTEGAIVRYRWAVVGKVLGRTIDEDHETTLVCAREDERWRAQMEHRRVIAKPPRSVSPPSQAPPLSSATKQSVDAARGALPTKTRTTPIQVNLVKDYKPSATVRRRMRRAAKSSEVPATRIRMNLLRPRGVARTQRRDEVIKWIATLVGIAVVVAAIIANALGW